MTDLYEEHLVLDGHLQHRRVSQLKARDRHPEYRETRVVESDSSDRAYLLGKVRVLTRAFEDADVSDDQTTIWVCSCDDYYFNQSDGLEDGSRSVVAVGECKHVRGEVKASRAMADDRQMGLGGVASDD